MAYSPPVGTVNLSLTGSYTPPVGTVNLSLGFDPALNRTGAISGVTMAPTGRLSASAPNFVRISGQTFAPTGRLRSAYDPNLLSAVHAHQNTTWARGGSAKSGVRSQFQRAAAHYGAGLGVWQEADARPSGTRSAWQTADRLDHSGIGAWQEACPLEEGSRSHWQTALHLDQDQAAHWQEGEPQRTATRSSFQVRLPLLTPETATGWRDGSPLTLQLNDAAGEGARLLAVAIEVWQQAGYPGNAPNPGPLPPPLPAPWPWGTNLHLRCPLPGTRLRLGRSPCIQIAERELPILPSYLSVNSASLVLLPERTVLPCTSMTIQTDSGSWGWQLDASLSGPEVFDLIKPFESGYPREVEATINGWKWTFVLEIPNRDQTFNRTNLRCTGWSTSLWLDDPYTLATTGRNAEARTANQLAEEALENTGWTLAWDLDDWLVPARRFEWENTKLGRVKRILKPVDACLYTHPYLKIMTAYPKYRIPSWLWGSETADIDIPNSLIISLKSEPNFSPTYNGVYISGTSHGVLAWVKVTGTDGMTQPDQPIVEALCCDNNGVAARMAGIAFLSSCGLGWTVTLDTVLGTNPALQDLPPLIVPGQLVSYNTHKAMVRGVSINASRSGGFMGLLSVRQRLELERREIEP